MCKEVTTTLDLIAGIEDMQRFRLRSATGASLQRNGLHAAGSGTSDSQRFSRCPLNDADVERRRTILAKVQNHLYV